jgi:hypothetical protein
VGTQVVWRTALARVLVRRGEAGAAQGLVREALDLSDGIDFPEVRLAALSAAAEVAEADGRAVDSRRLLEEARDLMAAKGNLVVLDRLEAALAQPVG